MDLKNYGKWQGLIAPLPNLRETRARWSLESEGGMATGGKTIPP
jgi:hypothetical protein